MADNHEVITISDDEGDCIVLSAVGKASADVRANGHLLPEDDLATVEDDSGGARNEVEQSIDLLEGDSGQEGRSLQEMSNVDPIPKDWTRFECKDQRVVVLGGDEDCIQKFMDRGAVSVMLFKTYPCGHPIASQVLALSASTTNQWIPCGSPSSSSSSPSSSWPLWKDKSAMDKTFHLIIQSFNFSEDDEEKEIGTITISKVNPTGEEKYSAKEEKTNTMEVEISAIFCTEEFREISLHVYRLAAIQTLVQLS